MRMCMSSVPVRLSILVLSIMSVRCFRCGRSRAVRLPRQLYVVLHRRRMDVACYAQGNLLFVNSFEYEHTDDILYYILYVWKQVGMDQQKDQLRLFRRCALAK